MKANRVLVVVALVFVCHACCVSGDSPFFKVFCQGTPLYKGRADPIVEPGKVSNHVHRVWGASNFDYSSTSESPVQLYNRILASPCTTCSITKDMSNYWIPDLYYRWPNGSITNIPSGGLTVYYLTRSGSGTQANPAFTAFPPGFRMTAGNPFKRNTTNTIPEKAITWSCISTTQSNPEVGYLPTATQFCDYGLRAQVGFPMCWDGVNLDSTNHQSHVAYPIENYNTGNCPSTHPVRLPFLFYEVLYGVKQFPHGQGTQPFLLACGDTTGYGLHGDFLNGWDQTVLQNTLRDTSCYAINTNNGNNVTACNTLRPFLKTSNPDQSCLISKPINNTEDIGVMHNIAHLAGCQPITGAGPSAPICSGVWPQPASAFSPILRVVLRSKKNGLYVTATTSTVPLKANAPANALSTYQVFLLVPITGGYAMQPEYSLSYVSATQRTSGPLLPARPSPSTWETFEFTFQGGSGPTQAGTQASIKSLSNNLFVTVNSNGELWPTAAAASTDSEQFYVVDANAGVTDTRTLKF